MENIYETNDIYLARTLLCHKGFKLEGSCQKDKDVYFKIKYSNKKSLILWLEKYLNHTATVDMEKYKIITEQLNEEIYQYKN